MLLSPGRQVLLRKLERFSQLALAHELDEALLLQVEEQLLPVLQDLRVQVVHALNRLRRRCEGAVCGVGSVRAGEAAGDGMPCRECMHPHTLQYA